MIEKIKKLKTFDKISYSLTFLASGFTIFILISVLLFTLVNGVGLLNFNLLTSDYNSQTYTVSVSDNNNYYTEYKGKLDDGEYYSASWGIALSDSTDTEGKNCIIISYIQDDSPLYEAIDSFNNSVKIQLNSEIASYLDTDNGTAYVKNGAEKMVNILEGASVSLAPLAIPQVAIPTTILVWL